MRRRLAVAALALVAVAVPAGPAGAADRPTLTVAPQTVRLGDEVTIAGRGWPVFESCSRRVRLTLQSVQNAAPIDVVRVRRGGRFTHRWTPEADAIGPGDWTVVARMRCESGDDGSRLSVRRATALRIR